ncbi:MAG: hypothetical protein AAB646_03140, partial [Patescibacteria group bacterium]
MLGFLMVLAGTFFEEIGTSIGKTKVSEKKESVYTMGFLNMLWGVLIFLVIAFLIKKNFVFSLASLPTFSIRVILEIAQIQASIMAINRAERSTFEFIRIGTVPLLLLVDVILGYAIGVNQIFGISLVVAALIFLMLNHGLSSAGIGYVIFSTLNAVATISLYKYNITHFNTVEAEQSVIMLFLMVYLFLMAHFANKENPASFLKKPIFLAQSFSAGVGSILISFAYLFAAASIITTAKRGLGTLWAIGSGKFYFHENHARLKLISLA